MKEYNINKNALQNTIEKMKKLDNEIKELKHFIWDMELDENVPKSVLLNMNSKLNELFSELGKLQTIKWNLKRVLSELGE